MKKIIRVLSVIALVIACLFGFSKNTNASNISIEMKDGARIRKDSIVALGFEATVENVSNEATYGFIYAKGEMVKEVLISNTQKIDKVVPIENNIIKVSFKVDVDDIDTQYTALAYAKIGDQIIYANKAVTRSVTQVAKNLGNSEEGYTKKISELAETYYDAKVTIHANGGTFDGSLESKEFTLKDPGEFPVAIKSGYRVQAYRDDTTKELYKSYPGTRKENQTKSYTILWELIPTAKILINQMIPEQIEDGAELPLEYEGNALTWTMGSNDYFTLSNGKFAKKNDLTHQTHDVTFTLNYKGETATRTYTIKGIQHKDLTGKNPFAIYFAVGSLNNYTSYTGHSVNNLFSDEVKEELDIVYYAFAYPTATGTLTMSKPSDYNTIHKQLMALRDNGTRIVLSISGTSSTTCGYFNTICDSATLRATFITNLMDLIEQEHFDGIDIDWESASSTNCVVATKLTLLMKELRAEMTKRSGTNGTPYTLTCATPATSWGASSDRFDFKKINSYLDYVNMMSYDLNHETNSSHVSPVYNSSYDKGYGFSADYGAKQFIKLGLSPEKIIIGTAAYGKTYKLTSDGTNTTYPGLGVAGTMGKIDGVSGSFASGTIYYSGVLQLLKNSAWKQYTEYNAKGQYVGNYLYNSTTKTFVAYEGVEMIKEKVKYAKENGYGIMIWSYCEDGSGNLCQAIAENIHK